ncbi:MAG: TonB-dependent receptor [Pseudomonadales bacterium]
MEKSKKNFLAAMIGFIVSGGVVVQDVSAAPDNGERATVLEEVIVSARKRNESLQDVPIAISVFDANDLRERSITQLEDVAAMTPGLNFEDFSNGGYGVPVIRGASQQDITILEQNVSTFFDGIYIPRSYAVDIGVVNTIERIEVVKGPQSALYGQNAFMGAINYVTRQPSAEFGGDLKMTYGSDERKDLGGSINIPLVEDKLFVRISATQSEFDGSWENHHPNANVGIYPGTNGNTGGYEKDYYATQVLFTPTETLELSLDYHKFETEAENGTPFVRSRKLQQLNCSPRSWDGTNLLWCGDLTQIGGAEMNIDPRTYGLLQESDVLKFGVDWDVGDSIFLSYIYGKMTSEVASNGSPSFDQVNGDAGSFPIRFTNSPVGSFDYVSHELRADFDNGGPFTGTVGAFFSDGDDFTKDDALLFEEVGGTEPIRPDYYLENGFYNADAIQTNTDVRSIFGSVSYEVNDRLRVSAEGRYTEEEKTVIQSNASVDYVESSYFTPRFTVEWDASESTLVYGSIAKGVKAAGINAEDSTGFYDPSEKFFDEDENWTYEVGTKSTLWDQRLQLNAAAYYIDWSNLQARSSRTMDPEVPPPYFAPAAITLNQGDATIYGAEVSGILLVTENFTANFGFSYTVPEYDDGLISGTFLRAGLCDGTVCPADADIGGNTLPRTANTQANVGGIWEGDLGSLDLGYYLQGDWTYQSEMFMEEMNVGTIPARTITNLSAAITSENWSVRLWAKNVFDKEYVSNSFFIANPFDVVYIGAYGPKRTFGLTVEANF